MPHRAGGQALRPLALLVLSLLLLLSLSATASAYPSSIQIHRLSVAMAASKPITVVTGANKGIGYVIAGI